MATTSENRYYYVKLYEGNTECSYSGYSKKRALFKVKSTGYMENMTSISFASIAPDTDIVITHMVITNLNENVEIKRHLKKRIKIDVAYTQVPRFAKGEITTYGKNLIRT